MNSNEVAKLFSKDWKKEWEMTDEGCGKKYSRPRMLTIKQTQWIRTEFIKEFKCWKDRARAEDSRILSGAISETEFWNVDISRNGCGIMSIWVPNQF